MNGTFSSHADGKRGLSFGLRGPLTSTHNKAENKHMKTLLSIITLTAVSFGLSAGTFAAEPKTKAAADAAKKAGEKTTEAAKSAAEKVTGEAKTIPMYARADVIDAKGKTFTTTRKDGVAVKHIITETTEVMNAGVPAKLADIKVSDYVSGSRKKVSDTEYTVVKITKFGPKAEKKEGEAKPAGDKPAEKKAN